MCSPRPNKSPPTTKAPIKAGVSSEESKMSDETTVYYNHHFTIILNISMILLLEIYAIRER